MGKSENNDMFYVKTNDSQVTNAIENFEKMKKKKSQPSCLFCSNSSTTPIKVAEGRGEGDSVRDYITQFLGFGVETCLREEDVMCTRCTNFFKHIGHTKQRLIYFLRNRDIAPDANMKKFNDILKEFTDFVNKLMHKNPNDSDETWEIESCGRSETPNPLVFKYCEAYDQQYEELLMQEENQRHRSNDDREVEKIWRRKRRGHNWSHRKGLQKSRARSRSYDTSTRYSSFSERRSMSRCTSGMSQPASRPTSRPTSKRQKRVVEGRPLKTRSVSRIEMSYVEKLAQVEADKFYCDHPDCSADFFSLDNYTLHRMLEHKDVARYNCSLCPNSYFTNEHLEVHSKVHDTPMHCFQCGKELEGIRKFQEHVQEHQLYSVNCLYCLMSFLTKKELTEHVATKHKKDRVRVYEKKSKIFESVSYKQISNRNTTANNVFKCITLNEGTPSPQLSDVHYNSISPRNETISMGSPQRSDIRVENSPSMETQDTQENSLIIDDSFETENSTIIQEVTPDECVEETSGVTENSTETQTDCIVQEENMIEIEVLTSENVTVEKIPQINEKIPETSGLSKDPNAEEIFEIILGNRKSPGILDEKMTKKPVVILKKTK